MFFLRYTFVICFIAGLMFWQSVPAARVGLRLHEWQSNVAIGIIAGVVRIAVLSVLYILIPGLKQDPTEEFRRKGSTAAWILILLVGAFAEELWIAFCLNTLRETGHSIGLSIILTAIVFGAAHWQYRLGGALATAMLGAISGLLFLWRGPCS